MKLEVSPDLTPVKRSAFRQGQKFSAHYANMGIVIVRLIEDEVYSDATIAWPIIVRVVLERLEKKRGKKFEAR